jgi:hypothetical protein
VPACPGPTAGVLLVSDSGIDAQADLIGRSPWSRRLSLGRCHLGQAQHQSDKQDTESSRSGHESST